MSEVGRRIARKKKRRAGGGKKLFGLEIFNFECCARQISNKGWCGGPSFGSCSRRRSCSLNTYNDMK